MLAEVGWTMQCSSSIQNRSDEARRKNGMRPHVPVHACTHTHTHTHTIESLEKRWHRKEKFKHLY
jgi:hypothetical protein